jgi:hypothetical protein
MRPSYGGNLRACIETLRGRPDPWVGRRELEEALGVSKTVAWRILRQCGARPGPGGSLLCGRGDLIGRLEELRDGGGKVGYEVRRRERLEAYLEAIRPEARARRTVVARGSAAEAMCGAGVASLPANVVLEPGCLRIQFGDLAELLQAVGALVYALSNDMEGVAGRLAAVETTTERD